MYGGWRLVVEELSLFRASSVVAPKQETRITEQSSIDDRHPPVPRFYIANAKTQFNR